MNIMASMVLKCARLKSIDTPLFTWA